MNDTPEAKPKDSVVVVKVEIKRHPKAVAAGRRAAADAAVSMGRVEPPSTEKSAESSADLNV